MSSYFNGVRNYFGFNISEESEERDSVDEEIPYVQYPLITREQMKKLAQDKFKFDFGYASFGFHSDSIVPSINSLSDLTDPTQLNSLLPRRRPEGSPSDTLSIKAGDDTMLVSPSVLAIADGVSGWESSGELANSGIWSRSIVETFSRLMTEYKISHAPHHLKRRDIEEILDDSFLHTSHLMDLQKLSGSSTLVLGMLSGDMLLMISIGDSKLFIIRDGKILLTNKEETSDGFCPTQIGTNTMSKMPSDFAWIDSVKLKEGDYIVMCSDGITDNLYESEIINYLDEFINAKKNNVKTIANKLLIKAKEVAFDDYAYTPYNEKVNQTLNKDSSRKPHSIGGKVDDMSIVVSKVVKNNKQK
ncbi:Protein phosphatase 2C family protein [Candida parapsilosis]|uniref:Protein phosphatase n=2 Tax=Candida parapsilosis TaxID=5480 RepID=G8BHT7_CANPC|nr:uncharacterized protein CPAR2_400030 [Candida parapsilosis]KAF6046896.1 Protein phosphatase 2C family protein [Candida parapsilosis]KAF6047291.1 Protein phosphatase 2C family protein [Candida parapsilosis]KAF6050738.1 Protein phosphatase 2C family protein [Candida parapsilosis]KAF6061857.1 Protein phosphatase 2C family protein [Candida parapsilosis]KAI5905830.1 Protein phosphatase PTC7 fig [Candida parapsilosis]